MKQPSGLEAYIGAFKYQNNENPHVTICQYCFLSILGYDVCITPGWSTTKMCSNSEPLLHGRVALYTVQPKYMNVHINVSMLADQLAAQNIRQWMHRTFFHVGSCKEASCRLPGCTDDLMHILWFVEVDLFLPKDEDFFIVNWDSVNNKHTVRVAHCMSDSLTEWLTDWITHWLNDSLTEWLTNWMTHWLNVSLTKRLADWMTRWPNGPTD